MWLGQQSAGSLSSLLRASGGRRPPVGVVVDEHLPTGCTRVPSQKLVMVGDRYMTDIVFGNRLGMLTIRPEPFTWHGEPQTVKMVHLILTLSDQPPLNRAYST